MTDFLKWLEEHFIQIVIGIAIIFIIVGAVGGAVADSKVWNDGYCTCGGKWQYMDSVTRMSGDKERMNTYTTYIYKCDKCGKMHEFNSVR